MDAGELLAKKKLRETSISVDVDGELVGLHIKALPRKEYRLLLEEHPGVKEGDDWNPDTFPPALIAKCVTDPVFTDEQAKQLWDDWEASDSGRVFLACFNLNEVSSGVGFTRPGSVKTDGSGQNSTT